MLAEGRCGLKPGRKVSPTAHTPGKAQPLPTQEVTGPRPEEGAQGLTGMVREVTCTGSPSAYERSSVPADTRVVVTSQEVLPGVSTQTGEDVYQIRNQPEGPQQLHQAGCHTCPGRDHREGLPCFPSLPSFTPPKSTCLLREQGRQPCQTLHPVLLGS